jgi:hypothetical protein
MLHLSRFSFICHSCEKTFAARSDDLYYFPGEDFVYHRHAVEFFPAIMIIPNGALRISTVDSGEKNVLQRYKLVLGPGKAIGPAGAGRSALEESSGRFFESMKRQHRNIEVEKISFALVEIEASIAKRCAVRMNLTRHAKATLFCVRTVPSRRA